MTLPEPPESAKSPDFLEFSEFAEGFHGNAPDTHHPHAPDSADDASRMDQHHHLRHTRRDAPGPADEPDDSALFGETADEAALRSLMHDAVRDLHASPDALDHLRRAIPVRRQRRLQATLGAAAAVVLVGMAVPTVIHVADRTGGAHTSPAGMSSSAVTPDTNGVTHPGSDSGPSGQASPRPGTPRHPVGGGPSGLPVSPTSGLPAPACTGDQLGQGTSQIDAPDSDGRVYGWFRVANVSTAACTVPGPGVVQAVAEGAADQAQTEVVDHTPGDAASGLPQTTDDPVALAPGQDYEIAFAFVPAGPNGGCTAPPTTPASPTPTATATVSGGTTANGGSGPSGGAVQPNDDPPATAPSTGIALDHTPATGTPVVTGPVIQGACAGTVYTTGVLPAPTWAPTS